MKATEVRIIHSYIFISHRISDIRTGSQTSLKKDLFFLRMQHATNQLDNPLKIAETKRDIARIKTVIREKEEN